MLDSHQRNLWAVRYSKWYKNHLRGWKWYKNHLRGCKWYKNHLRDWKWYKNHLLGDGRSPRVKMIFSVFRQCLYFTETRFGISRQTGNIDILKLVKCSNKTRRVIRWENSMLFYFHREAVIKMWRLMYQFAGGSQLIYKHISFIEHLRYCETQSSSLYICSSVYFVWVVTSASKFDLYGGLRFTCSKYLLKYSFGKTYHTKTEI